jgi:hypothetical protein
MAESSLNSILALDCGSATTTAALIEQEGGRYRLLALGQAASTYQTPWQDMTVGMLDAVRQVEKIANRPLFNTGGWPIIPQNTNRQGLDAVVIVSSAGLPLPVILAGLIKEVTLASARRAAATTYTTITSELSLEVDSATDGLADSPHRRSSVEAHLQAIQTGQPDVILLVGGADNGAVQPVVDMAQMMAMALDVLKNMERPAVLYAGNRQAREGVAAALGSLTDLRAVDNVRPSLEAENLIPVQMQLEELYVQRRMAALSGFQKLNSWSRFPIQPASKSFEKVIAYLGRHNHLNVIGADVGSRTTVISAQAQEYQQSVVRSDAGVGHSLASLLKLVAVEKFLRWLPFDLTPEELYNRLLNKTLHPTSIPETEADILIEQAVAREALRLVMAQVRSGWALHPQVGVADLRWNLVIGAGQTLTRTPQLGYAALTLLDGLEPWGVTSLVLDSSGLANMLGSVVLAEPVAAVHVAAGDTFVNLGTVIALAGQGQPGKTALKCKINYPNGERQELAIAHGSIQVIPLAPGEKATLELRPNRHYDIGLGQPGRGALVDVEGGILGVMVDARGRPLRLPTDDARRQAQIRQWLAALGVKEPGEADDATTRT